jgi:hypothetical protein
MDTTWSSTSRSISSKEKRKQLQGGQTMIVIWKKLPKSSLTTMKPWKNVVITMCIVINCFKGICCLFFFSPALPECTSPFHH